MTKNDPVRNMVLTAVQHHLLQGVDKPPLAEHPDNVIEVTTSAISASETRFRVKTTNTGIRYFTVKVSENF